MHVGLWIYFWCAEEHTGILGNSLVLDFETILLKTFSIIKVFKFSHLRETECNDSIGKMNVYPPERVAGLLLHD